MRQTVAAILFVVTSIGCSSSHTSAMKAIPVPKAESSFRAMLRESGVNLDRPSIAEVWGVFKRFASVPVDCHESGHLFQCGVYEFTGEPRVHFGFVRQFTVHSRGEFSHFNQLDIGFT